MKPVFVLPFLSLALGLSAAGARAQAPAAAAPKTPKEKLSYAIGMDVGETFKKRGIDVDASILAGAIKDSYTGASTQLTDAQKDETLAAFAADMRAKAQGAVSDSKKKGTDFLAANKAKPGVKTLPDGLQYKVLTEGSGPSPTAADTVTVKYRGTLIDGTEFDASDKHGGTASFPVGGVIKGWTEALQQMKVGSKYQLYIPSDLAYGERGTPDGSIAPGSTLIFDVELVSIDKK